MTIAAVFDVDGTLVTFEFDVRGTRGALIEDLAKRGFDTSAIDLSTSTQGILDHARDQVASGRAKADLAEVRASAYRILDDFEAVSSLQARVFPGTRETLDVLRGRGVRLAVLTNSGRKATEGVLRRGGLDGFFEFVLTRDDIEAMKPSPAGLAKAVSMLGLRPSDVYYVGDSAFDLAAARLAGVKPVCVATGSYSAERLRSEGADVVLAAISDLTRVLGS